MATINEVELAGRLFSNIVNINNALVGNLSRFNAVLAEYNAQNAPTKASIQATALEKFGVDWAEILAISAQLTAVSDEATTQGLVAVKNVF